MNREAQGELAGARLPRHAERQTLAASPLVGALSPLVAVVVCGGLLSATVGCGRGGTKAAATEAA